MALFRDSYRGHDFDRMVCLFDMKNGEEMVHCAVSWSAMDNLESARNLRQTEREAQFERLRDSIEDIASRKFFSMRDGERPRELVVNSIDR